VGRGALRDRRARIRTKVRRLNPFFNLRLDSAPYLAEIAWSRNEEDTESRALPSTGRAREVASATLGWFPVDLPTARLQYYKTELFDRTRQFEDSTEDRLEFTSDYRPVPELYLYYKGGTEDTDDRANETRPLAGLERRTRDLRRPVVGQPPHRSPRLQLPPAHDRDEHLRQRGSVLSAHAVRRALRDRRHARARRSGSELRP
jgi:hypothetical protein